MPSLTEDLQTNLRLSTGTQNTFNGDLHAYLDSVGIAKGQLNERMIAYVATLDSTVTNYSSAFSYALKNPQNFISPFASASFFAPLTSNLTLSKGTGPITSSRASTATVQAYAPTALPGNPLQTILCAANEARFVGARRISQGVWSETFADGTPIPATALQGALVEPAATNYAFPSGPQVAAVTCTTAALTAAAYTLSFKGTGTVVGTGGFVCNVAGSGANVVTKVTVTATAAAATLTPSGLVTELQLELGTTNTSVIPTTTAAVTRAADALTVPTAGNLTADQGWMYGEFTYYAGMGSWLAVSLQDFSNYIGLLRAFNSVGMRKVVAGVITDTASLVPLNTGTRYKLAGTWGPNGMFASLNGVALGSNASITPAVIAATVQLNAYQGGGEQGTGCQHRFGTTKLTQAQLNAMTA